MKAWLAPSLRGFEKRHEASALAVPSGMIEFSLSLTAALSTLALSAGYAAFRTIPAEVSITASAPRVYALAVRCIIFCNITFYASLINAHGWCPHAGCLRDRCGAFFSSAASARLGGITGLAIYATSCYSPSPLVFRPSAWLLFSLAPSRSLAWSRLRSGSGRLFIASAIGDYQATSA